MKLFLVILVVSKLLSFLFNWLRLVPDWLRPVLHNTYCFVKAGENYVITFEFLFKYNLKLTHSLKQ